MKKTTLIILASFVACHVLKAQRDIKLTLASVLQSNMVIQQNKPFKIWGFARPGDTVSISADWLATPVQVTAESNGKFIGIILVPVAKDGDFSKHSITAICRDQKITLTNLLIGDVWICSGQSNMQFSLRETIDSTVELAGANLPNIRLFKGSLNFSNEPIDSIRGQWEECSPFTARSFSAVAFHFGRELYQSLNTPIGIIFTGIGASAAQAYVPMEVLSADPLLDSIYLQPYLKSPRSKEKITGGFTFEKVTRPYLLYNAIIHPFINLSIRGFTWYQGESNRMERESYTRLSQAMIESWRNNFGQGSLPFYYVQVAPFWYDKADSTLADYAFFREAQEKIAELNNTEMVVTMDVGEARDLHPKNKKPIGVRLAKTALNREYGKLQVPYQGPQYNYVIFNKDKATIFFEPQSVQGGLSTKDGRAPAFFFIAGADKKFYPATAEIAGDRIIVSSGKVKQAVAVRYAFTNFPVTNLQNKAGYPAVPFRTDNWKESLTD